MTKLDELLTQIYREHVYIQTHNFPDPDAIASAYGLQELLKTRGITSTICYSGKIDRYSTSKLGELLGIELNHIENLSSILREEDEVILVDAQKGNSNIIDMTGDEIICIDHHPENEKYQYRFKDIRPEIGACATIIGSYFFENHVPITQNIATALTYGIRIDTNNLSRGVSKMDVDMIYKLYDNCDYRTIHMLENSTLCFDDLIAYSKAIASIEVFDNIGFADAGKDCPVIANVSDFILALKEVAFSVVCSHKEGGLKLSVRSELGDLDAGKIVHDALLPVGGDGGGHAEMAGGFVPFSGDESSLKILQDKMKESFLSVIEQIKNGIK